MVAPVFNLTVMAGRALVGLSGGTFGTPLNLGTTQPGEKTVLTAGSSQRYDLGALGPIRQMALLYTDLLAGETVTFTASTNADGTGVVWTSGALSPTAQALARPAGYRHFFVSRTDAVSARYINVAITAAANRTGGRLMVGDYIQPEFNSDYQDTSWGYEEPEDPELLDSGVEVLIEREPAPIMEFSLTWLTELEMKNDWEPLARLAHLAVPVLLTRDPSLADPHNGLFYGRLRLTPIVAADFDMYEVQAKMRSMI